MDTSKPQVDLLKRIFIFSNRFNLKFHDKLIEKSFLHNQNENLKNYFIFQIIISILLILVGLKLLIFSYFEMKNLVFTLCFIIYVSLFVQFVTIILVMYSKQLKKIRNLILETTNYFFLSFYSFLTLSNILNVNSTTETREETIFYIILFYSCKLIYITFFSKKFILIFYSNLLILLYQMVIMIIFFKLKTSYLYLAFSIEILTLILVPYSNELSERINFYLKMREMSSPDIVSSQEILNSIDYPICLIYNKNKETYFNRSFSDQIGDHPSREKTKAANNFQIFYNNREEVKEKTSDAIIEAMISKIYDINTGLKSINKDLYDYLYKLSGGKTSFSLPEFIEFFIPRENITNLIENQISHTENELNLVNITVNQFESNLKHIRPSNLFNTVGNAEVQNFPFISKSKVVSLGKVEWLEIQFNILCLVTENLNLSFIFQKEDSGSRSDKIETAKICKSIYFSKISHELKNPLCNLDEVISSIEDNLHFDNSNSIRTNKSNFEENSSSATSRHINVNLHPKIKNLKSISTLIKQHVKDFSFYSTLTNKDLSNTTSISSKPTLQSTKSKFTMINWTNYECNYQEIMKEVLNLFEDKISMENKESKIALRNDIEENLPELMELDKDYFKSLIFNLIFHLYSNMLSGLIQVSSSFRNEKIQFSFISKGVFIKKQEKSDNYYYQTIEEFYHLDEILNCVNPNIRQNKIDEFIYLFNLNLAKVYAKLLNLQILVETVNSQEHKIMIIYNVKERPHINLSDDKIYYKRTFSTGIAKEVSEKLTATVDSKLDRNKTHIFPINENSEESLGSEKSESIVADVKPTERLSSFKERNKFKYQWDQDSLPNKKTHLTLNNANFNPERLSLSNRRHRSNSEAICFKHPSFSTQDRKVFRVLLCDDEILIKKTMERFLEKICEENKEYEMEIYLADNGFECLNEIYKLLLKGLSLDLLIIDETMPLMKGSQVVNFLSQDSNFANLFIITYTSYNTPDKIEYFHKQGSHLTMTKPVSYEDFKNVIINWLQLE